jgi:hypothetical protein
MTLKQILKVTSRDQLSNQEVAQLRKAIINAKSQKEVNQLFATGNIRMYASKRGGGRGLEAKKETSPVFGTNASLNTIKQKLLDKLLEKKAAKSQNVKENNNGNASGDYNPEDEGNTQSAMTTRKRSARAKTARNANKPQVSRSQPNRPEPSKAIPLVPHTNQNATSRSAINIINALMKAGRNDEAMKRINAELKRKQNQESLKRLRNMKRGVEMKLGPQEIEARNSSRGTWYRPLVNRVYVNNNTGIKLVKREPVSGAMGYLRKGTQMSRTGALWLLEHTAKGPFEPLDPAALLNVLIRHKRRFFDAFMLKYEEMLIEFNAHASLISQGYTKVVTQELDNDLKELDEYRVGKYFIKGQIGTTELINKKRQNALKMVVEETTKVDPTMFDPEKLFNPVNSLF